MSFQSFRLGFTAAAATATIALASAAGAATVIDVQTYSASLYAGELASFGARGTEAFEGRASGEVGGKNTPAATLSTAVGTFGTLGGTGSGSTVKGTKGNSGANLYVRNAAVNGRHNTTAGGKGFLDSNDTLGMVWTISGLGMFDRVLFNLVDVGDVGATMTITAGGTTTTIKPGQHDGFINTVLVSFSDKVGMATIKLSNNKVNDGFAIDDAAVGLAPVPLPAAGVLLVAAIGGLGAAARRRKAA